MIRLLYRRNRCGGGAREVLALDVLEDGFTFPTMGTIKKPAMAKRFRCQRYPNAPNVPDKTVKGRHRGVDLAFTPSSLSKMEEVAIVGSIGDLSLTAPTTNPAWPEGFGELDISELLPTIDLTGLPTVTDGDFIVPSQTRYWPSY